MSEQHSVVHATFVIERTYEASPDQVFAAFSSAEAKAKWFTPPQEWTASPHQLDFRVGGREHLSVGPPEGPKHSFDAYFYDIVPGSRIVSTYEMHLGEQRMSVSLATVDLAPEGSGTRLTYTEQGAFLNGIDGVEPREQGTHALFDSLERSLKES